jgi:transcription elongation factor GreA
VFFFLLEYKHIINLKNQEKAMTPSYLTPEGHQRLLEELDYLRTTKRQEVADRLGEAMDGGEFIEDAEYEAAKNEQAFIEGRIQELSATLANARIIENTGVHDVIQIAAKVTIQEDNNGPEVYTIVGPVEADPKAGRISYESPLGRALIDRQEGDVVPVEAPDGSFTVRILKVE